jgi:hypothetical protein
VIVKLSKLQTEVRKGSNKAVKAKANLPIIKIVEIAGDRPIVPIKLYTAMELSTLVQGTGEVQEGMWSTFLATSGS